MRIAKKVLSVILAVLMAFGTFAALSFTASAETRTTVPSDSDINIQSDTTLTGTASNTRVTVTADCTIVLDGLTLTNTSNNGKCGIDVQSGTVNLIIKGTNKITAGGQKRYACPIGVREKATLIISGYNDANDGNILTVTGTTNGKAAIGGSWDQWTCGNIVINSGTIRATGAYTAKVTVTAADGTEYVLTTDYTIADHLAGDANGDGVLNLKDAVLIRRFLAGGWDVTIDASAADVDGDQDVTLQDVTLIMRVLAGGWDVTLV